MKQRLMQRTTRIEQKRGQKDESGLTSHYELIEALYPEDRLPVRAILSPKYKDLKLTERSAMNLTVGK